MADDIMAVDERVARLEMTVAEGFSEQNVRFTRLEHRFDALERKVDGLNARVDALNGKLDVVSESLEGKIQLVLERLDFWAKESRATTAAMQKEWQADRRLMNATLTDHRVRIEALEGNARHSPIDPSTS